MSNNFQSQNNYLRQFLDHERSYLNLLLSLELPLTNLSCVTCRDPKPRFRCSNCYGPHWWWQSCLVKYKCSEPFHQTQSWKDGSLENISLSELGYVFVLGHSTSGSSHQEDRNLFGDRRITVIHVNGVFDICVHFCQCQGARPEHEQLFSHQLFSLTFDQPKMVFTMDLLEYYAINTGVQDI